MSKRIIVFCWIACVTIVGCQRKETTTTAGDTGAAATQEPPDASTVAVDTRIPMAPPTYMDRCALGSQLAADGTVQESKQIFAPGEPISLTMWIKESPGGLTLTAQWYDAKEKMFAEDKQAMNGGKVATFTLAPKKKLATGEYMVKGLWGGNDGCAYQFKVEGPAKPAGKAAKKKKS